MLNENPITFAFKRYLSSAIRGEVEISEEGIEAFGNTCKEILKKQFKKPSEDDLKFRVRPSNLGSPLCQLEYQRAEAEGLLDNDLIEEQDYSFKLKMLIGDVTEAAVLTIMKEAGVDIDSANEEVSTDIGGINLKGTLDVVIDGKVYDVKSASGYSYDSKFKDFTSLQEDDSFGYIPQLVLYSEMKGLPAGGWIVINKVTGDIKVIEFPGNKQGYGIESKAREEIVKKIKEVTKDKVVAKPKRCFEAEEQTHYNKKTGEKVLPTVCGFCKYKKNCWGEGVEYTSKGSVKTKKWYVS